MSVKYYANRVQETSTTVGSGNLVLSGSTLGYRTFLSSIGANNKFSYYIYPSGSSLFEWEIGIGYITSTGGINQLVREKIVTSSTGSSPVIFGSGTKYIEPIIGEDMVNSSFINVDEKSSNFSVSYIPATYIIDASSNNVQVTLPSVSNKESIKIGFLLNKTIGNQYEQVGAVQLSPSGLETINGASSFSLNIKNDYIQIVSVPSQSGWLVLDPIQDSTVAYGNTGTIQFANNQAFTGVSSLSWNNSSLLVGGTGTPSSADIILPASTQTIVFNEQSLDKDFRVEGSGNSHLLFTDASVNRVGINTSNLNDTLTITSSSGSGITVRASGVGPKIVLQNTSVSGLSTNNQVGSLCFSGLNSTNSSLTYGEIYTKINSTASGSENSAVLIDVVSNGSQETAMELSNSGITLGFNSSNINGIVLGGSSSNEGDNIVLGYFNDVCGNNSVVLGNNTTVSSGTFGGAVGTSHSVSGSNIWVVGGSGVTVSGNNSTYLALNNKTYLQLKDSNNLSYITEHEGDCSLSIKNNRILSSGVNENIVFGFVNSSGVSKTGLVLSNSIKTVSNNQENSSLIVKQLSSGSLIETINLSKESLVVGENSNSGNNIVYGHSNAIVDSGNIIVGKNIQTSGTSNILFGNSLVASGTNITVFGSSNVCGPSGDMGVILIGNNNNAYEAYVTAIGDNNASSGLYAVSCGYNNGSHGNYSVGIGSDNLVKSNASVAVGRSNNLDKTALDASLFAIGIGNTASISDTGVLIGHSNSVYGSGGLVCGINSHSSGNNNIVLGINSYASGVNNTILGNNISWSGSNTVLVSGLTTVSIKASTSGVLSLNSSGLYYSGYTTTGGGSNLVIENNIVKAATSSIRYKENILPYDKGLSVLENVEPVYYNFKNSDTQRAGLIAEQIADIGLEEFIVRNSDNSVESIKYDQMIVLLINAIKELKKEIDDLKNQK